MKNKISREKINEVKLFDVLFDVYDKANKYVFKEARKKFNEEEKRKNNPKIIPKKFPLIPM